VLEESGVRVTAFRVSHPPVEPAVGYRFEYGGRSVVVSGDTRKSANLQHFAEGADLLVHDSLSRELVAVITRANEAAGRTRLERITRDIVTYHASPLEAAEVARDAHVRHLVLTHVVPPLPFAPLEEIFLDGVADVFENVTLGRDGTLVVLPAGSDRVIVEQRL
jgi:ribonuclease Z